MRVSILAGDKKHELNKIKEEVEVSNLTELGKIVTTYNWSPFLFQDAHPDEPTMKWRKAENMCGADVFAIDVDEGMTLDEAINIVKRGNIAALIGTSKSHQKEKNGVICDRFRIILKLESSLIIQEQVRALFNNLLKLFPSADKACKDAARLYYPCQTIVLVNEGAPLGAEWLQIAKPKPLEIEAPTNAGQLSKKTMAFIQNGAEQGKRNKALIDATHDAIQQGWSQDDFIELLKTQGPEWATESNSLLKIEERYNNFTPAHPPRVQNQAKRFPINQIRPFIELWLEKNNISVSYNRTVYMDKHVIAAGDVIRKIVLTLSEMNMGVEEKLIEYNFQEWIESKRQYHLDEVRHTISRYLPEEGEKECRRFLSVLKASYTELDLSVLKHMLWQVKRKINGYRTKYEMMMVLTGGQGAGKSYALREYLFKPLGDLAYSSAGFEAMSDSREGRLFSDHYIIMFDEMSGAQKTDMERTKQMITSGIIKQRRMGTTSHDSLPMSATFFGTANMPLESLIRDQTGMRRFWELVVDPSALTSSRWPVLADINYETLWAAVDSNQNHSPIESCLKDVQLEQEKLRDRTIFEWLIEDGVLELTDNKDEFTSALALTNAVSTIMGSGWSSKSLSKEWKRANLPRFRTSIGMLYGVKIVDRDIKNTLRTKYSMKLSEKDAEGFEC